MQKKVKRINKICNIAMVLSYEEMSKKFNE